MKINVFNAVVGIALFGLGGLTGHLITEHSGSERPDITDIATKLQMPHGTPIEISYIANAPVIKLRSAGGHELYVNDDVDFAFKGALISIDAMKQTFAANINPKVPDGLGEAQHRVSTDVENTAPRKVAVKVDTESQIGLVAKTTAKDHGQIQPVAKPIEISSDTKKALEKKLAALKAGKSNIAKASPSTSPKKRVSKEVPSEVPLLKIGYRPDGTKMTKAEKQAKVAEIINKIPEEMFIATYPAVGEKKRTMVVFSDFTCGYCKNLHNIIPDLNKSGVEIKYLAFPRALAADMQKGHIRQRSRKVAQLMSYAACAKDPEAALDYLYKNNNVEYEECDADSKVSPEAVGMGVQLGRLFGVEGTPFSVFDTGHELSGVGSAGVMKKYINSISNSDVE
ncbi:thioredoxin fold domain-containing protein [Neptuniibacter sp. QD37_11]|uniref:thioredoxin fold domain-containing protein n=1 Tax=Neptuniibacter sp. QD37_11 TaxID=3398209 RepID=UPI0039F53E9F